MNSYLFYAVALAVALGMTPAYAGGSHSGGHGASAIGKPAKASQANRTVEVVMHDSYYEPEIVSVEAGETVRFKIRNAGSLVHEFGIGTTERFKSHLFEMKEMMKQGAYSSTEIMKPKMMHHSGNSVMLEPGDNAELVWFFPDGGEVDLGFACTVPGHYEAGMQGDFRMDQSVKRGS